MSGKATNQELAYEKLRAVAAFQLRTRPHKIKWSSTLTPRFCQEGLTNERLIPVEKDSNYWRFRIFSGLRTGWRVPTLARAFAISARPT